MTKHGADSDVQRPLLLLLLLLLLLWRRRLVGEGEQVQAGARGAL